MHLWVQKSFVGLDTMSLVDDDYTCYMRKVGVAYCCYATEPRSNFLGIAQDYIEHRVDNIDGSGHRMRSFVGY